ncbi:transglycosylase domain-containing protein [Vagococcus xieshaowenii]|uniref:Penicillin-binding protein n=1 Tax=Vagococcus xieshaowenii TaxID=2562451 RepID=A0AAJ5EDT9_9ENTE|nr:transglycosylase domain-containing protein [Vagococcus xieshaowenii]QCA28637.1 penicillin-binding protein [Vagococcus xieshaowenii]TFZ40555.1 penicillin-binding protein [Vagococcus xieshaowenii]
MIVLKTRRKNKRSKTVKDKLIFGGIISMEVIKSTLYLFLGLLLLGGSLGAGIVLGYFTNLTEHTKIPEKKELKKAINNIELVSHINYADGQKIADLRSDIVRTRVSSDQISPLIKNALIATEDEYFNIHKGIVPKALIRAMISDVTGLGGQSGGSTITQQLVKQQLLTNELSFSRKANEILYAVKVEEELSKEEILTAYLNVSPFGRNNKGENIAGVEEASEGIFGVKASEVNLPQAAYIAGLPQSPIVYSPYTNTGELKDDNTIGIDRQQQVLANMYREKLISKKEYEEAKAYDISKDFRKQEKNIQDDKGYLYYLVESEAIKTLMKMYYTADKLTDADIEKDDNLYSKYYTLAERDIRLKGYTIETTIDKDVYYAMNNAVKNNEWLINDWSGNQIQNGSVLMENSTGKVLGFVGGLDYSENQNNHAFQTKRSPGSTMKPILAYAPAIDVGLIGSETMLPDFKRNYKGNSSDVELTNYGKTSSESFISVRNALKKSGNITVVNLYQELLNVTNPESYFDKMKIDMGSDEFLRESIPLGAMDYGMSVFEQTNAYQTLANGGTYQEGHVIQKITDSEGNVVFEHKNEPVQVYKKSTASIMNNLMRDVLTSGTGTTAKNYLYGDVAYADWVGKTGTSESDRDFWFTASTPGVTLSSWIGKSNTDNPNNVNMPQTFGQNNMQLWAAIANAAYQVKPDAFETNKKFTLDSSVKSYQVSDKTGTTIGSFQYNSRNYYTPGKNVTAYYAEGNSPSAPTYQFGVGGTTENYDKFWNQVAKDNQKKKNNTTTKKTNQKTEKKNEKKDKDDD